MSNLCSDSSHERLCPADRLGSLTLANAFEAVIGIEPPLEGPIAMPPKQSRIAFTPADEFGDVTIQAQEKTSAPPKPQDRVPPRRLLLPVLGYMTQTVLPAEPAHRGSAWGCSIDPGYVRRECARQSQGRTERSSRPVAPQSTAGRSAAPAT